MILMSRRSKTITMSKLSEARKRANRKYDAAHSVNFGVKFNRKTDADILDFLETLDNKAGYIKNLIRADIASRENK